MGYYTYVTGEIKIEPPVPYQEFKDAPYGPGHEGSRDVKLLVEESVQEIPEGQIKHMFAVAVVPAQEDGFKAYNIEEHLQELVPGD